MTSPYKKRLEHYLKSEVTIDRDGAASVTGTVVEIEDDAFLVKESTDDDGVARFHYIVYDNVRGVSNLDHDLDIGH